MAALSVDELLAVAAEAEAAEDDLDQAEGGGEEPDVGESLLTSSGMLGMLEGLEGNTSQRPHHRRNKRAQLTRVEQKNVRRHSAQAQTFNRIGLARTADHRLTSQPGKRKRKSTSIATSSGVSKVKGSSAWRRWTPEAILRTASIDPLVAARRASPEGSGPSGTGSARAIQADCVLVGQERGAMELVAKSKEQPLDFFIGNNMSDETKLPFGKPAPKKRRCLAWHSQGTWGNPDGSIVDVDVVRPPRLIDRYTAATLWGVMGQECDTMGLRPCGEALPAATYHVSLTASDTHSVNCLISKYLPHVLGPRHFHIGSYCMQHRTGSVCEEVANRFGLLPSSLCLATQMEHGDFHTDVERSVEAVISKYLVVSEHFESPEDEECERLCLFARELLRTCHVMQVSRNDHEETADDVAAGEKKRTQEADDFVRFFMPPWIGVLRHPCPAGCCGILPCADREASVKRGTQLVMQIVCPHMSRPAANRYTKVFPVIGRICLQLHFFKLFKKAIRMLLKGQSDHSDDDSVLHDANAVLGAPVDAIGYHRKLQAFMIITIVTNILMI